MDDQDKSMKERWAPTTEPRERGYATEPEYASGDYATPPHDENPQQGTRVHEIRSEIDRTRDDMSETIDAIQDRLNPRNVVSRAAGNVREATMGKVRQMAHDVHDSGGILERIRENPIPAALAAASLAWIAFGGRRGPRPQYSRAIYGSTRGGESYVREARIDLGDDAEQSSESWAGRTGWNDDARHSVHRAGSQMRAAQRRARHMTDERPFAAGAIAAALGLAIGLAIPETEREDELMGSAKDALIERGRETVRDAAGRVQNAAAEVQRVAGDALTATSSGDDRNRSDHS